MQFCRSQLAAICLAVAATSAFAEEAKFEFSIPSQPLPQALTALSLQCGVRIAVADGGAKNHVSPAIQGRMSVGEALSKALQGSGLTFQFTSGTTVLVKEMPAVAEAGTQAVEVVGSKIKPVEKYVVKGTSAATRVDALVIDTPVSISAVSRSLMDDRQVQNLMDAVQSTSGVVNNRDPWGPGFQDAFNIRGFDDASTGYYYDSLRVDALTAETENLETVEVAKGPASALYGNESSEGGVVNLSVKRPLAEARRQFKATGGSFNYFKGVVDLTGPLDEAKTLRYRVVAVDNNEGSPVQLGSGHRQFGAASIEWLPREGTSVLLRQEYDSIKTVPSESGPLYGATAITDLPATINIIAPANYRTVLNATRLDWSQKLDENWKITQRNQFQDNKWNYVVIFQGAADPITSVPRAAFGGTQSLTNQAHNLDLTGKVETGSISHALLLGLDYRRYKQPDFVGFMMNADYLPNFDFTHPDYYKGVDWAGIKANSTSFASLSDRSVNGLYFQDMATLSDQWRLMAGGRFDYVRSRSSWSDTLANAQAQLAASDGSDHAFSPRVGLLYKARPDWSVYASYATGFGANNGTAWDGSKLKPNATVSYELGSKNEYFGGKASSSVAVYQIIKSNVLLPDTVHSGFSVNAGHVESRGFDLDFSGQLTAGLSTTAVLGYNDIFTLEDNSLGLAGTKLPNSRHWRGSVWLKYQFGPTEDEGLSLGGGVFFASAANLYDWGTNSNRPYQGPGWNKLDLSASYGWRDGTNRWTARLSVKNALNQRYVDAYYYATPLNAVASVELKY